MKLVYGVKDKPKFGQLIVFAFQQLLAILAATIAVPAIIGNGMSQSAALFGAGVGTIVYLLFTKFKSPVFLGSSFAFLGSMAAAFAGAASVQVGYAGLIIGAAFAGLVYVVIALIVKFAGTGWINKLMPAVVIGPTVAIIGLSLAGNAIGDLQTVKYSTKYDQKDYQIIEVNADSNKTVDAKTGEVLDYTFNLGSVKGEHQKYVAIDKDAPFENGRPLDAKYVHEEINVEQALDENGNPIENKYNLSANLISVYVALICGLVTLFAVIIASVFGKNISKLIPFIIGILAGYAVASIFTFIGWQTGNEALKVIDFSVFKDMKIFAVPDFTFLEAFKANKIDAKYITTVAVAYIPVAFVVFAEHIADHKNLSSVIESDLLEEPGLHRTLLGDGVGSMVGAFFGGCPNTTYGESVGCVAITGNASVVTILATAVMAIAISFFAPFVTFLSTIPNCVMGGVCITLYGFIAVSGLKMIKDVDLNDNGNLFTVAVILICGIGGLAVSFGEITITSIACALILGILTNLLVSKKKKKNA